MKDFGAALRKAREEAGLTIKDLYNRTRINAKYLDAIERGNFPSLPQTYIRAFIKDYAREVGLNEQQVIDEYNRIAEELKGVSPPPPPLDTSGLIPHLDDSIEIVLPDSDIPISSSSPRKIEIAAKREIEIPINKIETHEENSKEKIVEKKTEPDIRVVQETIEFDKKIEAQKPDESKKESIPEIKESIPEIKTEKKLDVPVSTEKISLDRPTIPQADIESKEIKPSHKNFLSTILSSEESESKEKKKTHFKPGKPTRVYDTKPIPPSDLPERAPIVKPIPPVEIKKEKNAPPVKRISDSEQLRRKRIAAWLILIILIVTIYAVIKFGTEKTVTTQIQIDSTKIAAQLNANKFVDSTQFYLPEQKQTQQETILVPKVKEEQALEPVKQTFSAEDSLVLEAFSSASVWFSIRMDTTRSERGSMSTNEHRVWKAKDRFMITLGDAGAVTFMLNGKDIGSLGEEGLVVKNVTINRQSLSKNQ